MGEDAFGHLEWNDKAGKGAIVVGSLEAGLTRLDLERGEDCGCPCRGIVYNGVLYGPGSFGEVGAVVRALEAREPEAEFSFGDQSFLRETESPVERRPLSDFPLDG